MYVSILLGIINSVLREYFKKKVSTCPFRNAATVCYESNYSLSLRGLNEPRHPMYRANKLQTWLDSNTRYLYHDGMPKLLWPIIWFDSARAKFQDGGFILFSLGIAIGTHINLNQPGSGRNAKIMLQPWYEPTTFGRQRSENYVDITEVTKHHFFVIWIPAIVTCWMLGDCGYIVLSWTFWWMPLTPLPSKYSSRVTSARRVSRHTYRVWRNPGTQARGGTNTQGVANMQHPRINIRWEHSRIVYITV